jgi:hypothetical protein
MPTKELKQALRTANVRNAEKDLIEVLARMFDAPAPLVARIVYAAQTADAQHEHIVWEAYLDEKLRKAIRTQTASACNRAYLRSCVENQGHVLAFIEALVPEDQPEMMCNGCPKSLACVADSLSTPELCRNGRGVWARSFETRPVKINGDTVTVDCDHPRGRFELNVKDFDL